MAKDLLRDPFVIEVSPVVHTKVLDIEIKKERINQLEYSSINKASSRIISH
jgi:hypothetical protein